MKKPQSSLSANTQIIKTGILSTALITGLAIPVETVAIPYSMEMTFILFAVFFFSMIAPYVFTKGSLQSDERICKNQWKDPICLKKPFSVISPLAQMLSLLGLVIMLKAFFILESFSLYGGLFLVIGQGMLIGMFIMLKLKEEDEEE